MIFPAGVEHAWRLGDGVVEYVAAHSNCELLEIAYPYGQLPTLPPGPLPFDGAIVWAGPEDLWAVEFRNRGIPLVNCNGDLFAQGVPGVKFDDHALAATAANHLAEVGVSCMAFVAHRIRGHPAQSARLEGLRRSAAALGLAVFDHEQGGEDPFRSQGESVENDAALATFLSQLPKPAGIWCEFDQVAVQVCRVARQLGLGVPEQLAVLGTGDFRFARVHVPSISSIPISGRLLGYEAASRLVELVRKEPTIGLTPLMPSPHIIARESTRAPGHAGFSDDDDEMALAHRLIQQRAVEGLTVDNLVQVVHLSRKTLTNKYKARYGMTPGQAIRHIRVELAKSLLANGTASITRVGSICGFEDGKGFNLFFKRETGISPSQYRSEATQSLTAAQATL